MLLEDALKETQRVVGGFRVSWEDDDTMKTDSTPDQTEAPFATVDQAVTFAQSFAERADPKFVNIRIVDAVSYESVAGWRPWRARP